MTTFAVRPYRDKDFAQARELFLCLEVDLRALPIPPELQVFDEFTDVETGIAYALSVGQKPPWRTFVADCGDSELVGLIGGRVMDEPHQKIDKIGSVEILVVAEDHRGQGVGRSLMSTLVEWFKEQGCQGVKVETWSANAQAIKAYEHMGFREYYVGLVKLLQAD